MTTITAQISDRGSHCSESHWSSLDQPYAAARGCAAMSAMGDIDEIKQVKYRYLRALDTKHWDDFADTLTEDVIGDYGASIGE